MTHHPRAGDDPVSSYRPEENEIHVRYRQRSRRSRRRSHCGRRLSGCRPRGRLSEDPTRSVLLLEAGRAYGVDGYPDDLRDAAHVPANPEHEWGFTARGGAASPEIDAARCKVLGGCSAHNATVAMRARPSDIRDWQRHGLDDWTIEDVYGHLPGDGEHARRRRRLPRAHGTVPDTTAASTTI